MPEFEMRLQSEKGFTLIEMVASMAVFAIVIMMVGSSFSTLLKYSSRYMKSEESNIEGNVGLELLRHDVASAGFGLPLSFLDTNLSYQEVESGPGAALNDSPSAGSPSAVPPALSGLVLLGPSVNMTDPNNNSYATLIPPNGSGAYSDYLALKGTSLGTSVAAQKWTYATFNAGSPGTSNLPNAWPSASDNFNPGDQMVVMGRTVAGSYQLLNAGAQFSLGFTGLGLISPFNPKTSIDTSYMYGVADAGSATLRFPYNRADFFVATPPAGMLPSYCAPNTGILYRGMVRHLDGNLDFQPVLDCVADMHVVLGWSSQGTGDVDTWSKVDGSGVSSSAGVTSMRTAGGSGPSAVTVNQELKVVKVYILAQNGKQDPGYTSPSSFKLYNPAEEGQTPGATYTLQSNMMNYRWKVYKLVIRPKNLSANQ